MDQFWAAPPISRTLALLTFIESVLVYGEFISPFYVGFNPRLILKIWPELWRLFTPFLITGSGLSFLLDLYFMYHYASQLETGSPRFAKPGDFFIYVMFVGFVIMLTAGCYFGAWAFTKALIMAFLWTFCQDNKHRKIKIFIISVPALLAPLAILTLTLVLQGQWAALVESMGIVAAHLYDFLTRIYPTFGGGRNFVTTPRFIQNCFTKVTPWGDHRTYGVAYRPETRTPTSASTGWTSSLQSPWSTRGQGRRLGGN